MIDEKDQEGMNMDISPRAKDTDKEKEKEKEKKAIMPIKLSPKKASEIRNSLYNLKMLDMQGSHNAMGIDRTQHRGPHYRTYPLDAKTKNVEPRRKNVESDKLDNLPAYKDIEKLEIDDAGNIVINEGIVRGGQLYPNHFNENPHNLSAFSDEEIKSAGKTRIHGVVDMKGHGRHRSRIAKKEEVHADHGTVSIVQRDKACYRKMETNKELDLIMNKVKNTNSLYNDLNTSVSSDNSITSYNKEDLKEKYLKRKKLIPYEKEMEDKLIKFSMSGDKKYIEDFNYPPSLLEDEKLGHRKGKTKNKDSSYAHLEKKIGIKSMNKIGIYNSDIGLKELQDLRERYNIILLEAFEYFSDKGDEKNIATVGTLLENSKDFFEFIKKVQDIIKELFSYESNLLKPGSKVLINGRRYLVGNTYNVQEEGCVIEIIGVGYEGDFESLHIASGIEKSKVSLLGIGAKGNISHKEFGTIAGKYTGNSIVVSDVSKLNLGGTIGKDDSLNNAFFSQENNSSGDKEFPRNIKDGIEEELNEIKRQIKELYNFGSYPEMTLEDCNRKIIVLRNYGRILRDLLERLEDNCPCKDNIIIQQINEFERELLEDPNLNEGLPWLLDFLEVLMKDINRNEEKRQNVSSTCDQTQENSSNEKGKNIEVYPFYDKEKFRKWRKRMSVFALCLNFFAAVSIYQYANTYYFYQGNEISNSRYFTPFQYDILNLHRINYERSFGHLIQPTKILDLQKASMIIYCIVNYLYLCDQIMLIAMMAMVKAFLSYQ